MDLATRRVLDEIDVDETVTAWAQLDYVLFAAATADKIRVVWLLGEDACTEIAVADPAVTCLAARANGDGALLAAGHGDGSVTITRLSSADAADQAPQWRRQIHDGPVTDILIDAEEQVITGSTDRSLCVTAMSAIRSDPSAKDDAKSMVQRLHLTLRCKGVRFDGVTGEREQEKLRRYAQS